jgi:superoxide reductase
MHYIFNVIGNYPLINYEGEVRMLVKKQIYKCKVCGNVVEALWNGKPNIFCCGSEMSPLAENTVEASKEKHIPVIERDGVNVKVKVGSVAHPMTPEHYILCIEVLAGDKVYRHDLKQDDTAAEASFMIGKDEKLSARAYCNLHGLWAVKEA